MKISPNGAASRLTAQTAVTTTDLAFWQSLLAGQNAEVKLFYVRALSIKS